MEADQKLSERVHERLNGRASEIDFTFSPALLDAMRLADLFESVKPNEYILPLDALAGFSNYQRPK